MEKPDLAKGKSGFLFQGLSKSLAMRDQMEVGTAFAAEYVSPQYPDHYNRAFAFSILLYPQP
ncbi:MAG: hypothetical protein CMG93_10440 [Marinomonas sp.]|nr:hypothetical protein [Marinomonas sp.]